MRLSNKQQGQMPRVLIAGTHSGSGKTTITMGLLKLLSRKYNVQPFKVGPDYIDPMFHSHITGNPCRNLDSFMLDESTIPYLFHEQAKNVDYAIVEGVMGLFDGANVQSEIGSTAHIAKLLNCPVILVIDAKGMSKSAVAMLKGYADFDKDLKVTGVIFNNVGSDYHYKILEEAVNTYTNCIPLGYLRKDPSFTLPSRHLGLVPSSEVGELDSMLEHLADAMEETINVDGLLALFKDSELNLYSYEEPDLSPIGSFHVAVAYDEAFNFYYADNIDLLKKLGGEITYFSPLADKEVPHCDLLYLGGGFPEMFAKALEDNVSMRQDIKRKLEDNLHCIAECGGYMYLTDTITDLEDRTYDMVGLIKGHSSMTGRLQRFGYACLELGEDCLYGQQGDHIQVHEFHRSIVQLQEEYKKFYSMSKKRGEHVRTWLEGVMVNNTMAGYPHLHWYSNPDLIQKFIMKLCEQG